MFCYFKSRTPAFEMCIAIVPLAGRSLIALCNRGCIWSCLFLSVTRRVCEIQSSVYVVSFVGLLLWLKLYAYLIAMALFTQFILQTFVETQSLFQTLAPISRLKSQYCS